MSIDDEVRKAKLEEYNDGDLYHDDIELYKVIMLGDSGSGKTSIVQQYVLNKFYERESNTIGVSYLTKKLLNTKTKNMAKLCIWDTAGQDRFFSIVKMYFKFARGICCVYDITRPNTLKNCERWIEEAMKSLPNYPDHNPIPITLIGNKIDLQKSGEFNTLNDKSCIRTILELEKKYNLKHFTCSAKTGENIKEAIEYLVWNMEPNVVKNEFLKSTNIKVGQTSTCNCY